MLSKKLSRIIALLIVVVMLAAGCAPKQAEQQASPETTQATQTSGTTENTEPKYGGVLRVAKNEDPASLDMHVEGSESAQTPGSHIFEPILTTDAGGNPVPMLCYFEVQDEGKKIVLTLRQNVKFHNGDIMDQDDIIASINRWLKYSSNGKKTIGNLLASIEKSGTDKVIINLNGPSPLATMALANFDQGPYVMPKEVIEAAGEDKVKEYIGTGPYKFEEWQPDRYIRVTKFKDYTPIDAEPSGLSGKKYAYVDEIQFIPGKDPMTKIAGVQSGDYDISLGVPSNMFNQLSSDPNLRVELVKMGIFPAAILNMKEGIMTNQKLRQAVLLCLNMEEIMLASEGDPNFYELHPCWQPSGTMWWNDIGKDLYNKPDLEKAKQLVKESGYNGEKIIWLTSKTYDYFYKPAMIAGEMMKKIGLNVEFSVVDRATLGDLRNQPDKYNIFSAGMTAKPDPSQIAFLGENWAGWYDTPKKRELMEKLTNEVDQNERKKAWEQICELLYEEVPAITFGERKSGGVMNKKVQGFFEGDKQYYWNMWINE
ncbi:MAG TPA: ABC transporter substrate-binding protein [Clostridia bacterium]|nr:ABC transporter substrate-binding protein [Clostridia bacterium]